MEHAITHAEDYLLASELADRLGEYFAAAVHEHQHLVMERLSIPKEKAHPIAVDEVREAARERGITLTMDGPRKDGKMKLEWTIDHAARKAKT